MLSFLKKTTKNIISLIGSKKQKLTKDELEEILIECDVDYDVVERVLDELPSYVSRADLQDALLGLLKLGDCADCVDSEKADSQVGQGAQNSESNLLVNLIIGVNGAGKTTTIARLANFYKKQNKRVMLGAGDTFRAAAIEQIKAWGERLEVPVVASKNGADPSALCFDAISSAIAKNYDVLLLDTAGRLHTQTNLTNELLKIIRVSEKAIAQNLDSENAGRAVLKKLLVLDGTQGSSSVNQAKYFAQHTKIDGVIVTKLDGSSKGGAIFSIVQNLGLPILYIGVGEGADDLVEFDARAFVDTLLDCMFE